MSERKVVDRSITIGLGIVCIALIVGLVGVVFYYNLQVNTLNNDKTALTSFTNQLETWLAGNITSLQNQVNNLTDILNLNESMIWVNHETKDLSTGVPYQENVPYAGYVVAEVSSSQSNETMVWLTYSSYGVNYDNRISVGSGGTAIFPVLPSSNILIFFYQADPHILDLHQYAIVTITYYY